MIKNKIILMLALSILLTVFLVSSQSIQTLGVFKQNDCINLIQICSDCSYNNISNVISPNSTIVLSSSSMQKTGTYFNYTFCNTTQLGRYIVNGYGDVGGTLTVWSYDFSITSSGTELKTSDSILSILFFFGILIISIIFFGLSLVFNNRKTIFVSIFFLSMGIMIVIVDFVYIMNIMNRYQESMGYASSIFNNLYYLITLLLIVGGFTIVVFLFVYAMTRLKEIRYGDSVK